MGVTPRRKMERSKGKGHRIYLGAEFIQFLATLDVLPLSIWERRLNSLFTFKATDAKKASAARNLIYSAPSNRRYDLYLFVSLHPSSIVSLIRKSVLKIVTLLS